MNGDQEILGDYAQQGFSLQEYSDDCLELYFKDRMIGVFSQIGATKEGIRGACGRFMEKLQVEVKT